MNLEEAAKLLGLAAARDNRTPSNAMALAWHEDLGDLDFDVAREALRQHYRTSTDYLMPVHIRRLSEDVIREQRRAIREAKEKRLAIEAAAETDARPLKDRAPAIQEFVRQQALKFAVPEADRKHQLALKRARAENGRPGKVQRSKPAKSARGERLPDPASDHIAGLATAYLLDGYEPKDVSERLGISRKWCETTIRRFKPKES